MLARLPFLAVFGYGSYFFLVFVLFAYWTFPYERAVEHLTRDLAAQHDLRITVDEVDPYWLTGVEVEDAHIMVGDLDVHVLRGHARASLMTVLGSAQDVEFAFDLATGSLEGAFQRTETQLQLNADLENIQLGMFPMLAQVTAGLPLQGAATGNIDLRLDDEPDKSEGIVDLTLKKLRIGDGEAKLSVPGVPALTVDPVDAGDLKIQIKIAEGVANLDLSADGKDLQLVGTGEVRLGKSMSTSRPNIALSAKFTDAYKTKTPRTEAMFSLLEGSNSRQLKRAMGPEGAFSFQLTGSLSQPRFTPGRPTAAPTLPGGRRAPMRPGRRP